MSDIHTSLTINASPETVWRALTDFDAYPQWTKVISGMRAEPRVGGLVRFRIAIEGLAPLPIAARLVRWEPGREFAWRGGAPGLPALAWGEHWFRLTPSGEATLLTHGENFGGLLSLAMRTGLHARVTRTYEAFNRALKARAEG
jgi:hypothetical protein